MTQSDGNTLADRHPHGKPAGVTHRHADGNADHDAHTQSERVAYGHARS